MDVQICVCLCTGIKCILRGFPRLVPSGTPLQGEEGFFLTSLSFVEFTSTAPTVNRRKPSNRIHNNLP